jgi:hypothetical protein
MAFETRTGVSTGGVVGIPQAELATGEALGAGEPHAAMTKARTHRNGRRRGLIGHRVSNPVGTCRRGKMAAS